MINYNLLKELNLLWKITKMSRLRTKQLLLTMMKVEGLLNPISLLVLQLILLAILQLTKRKKRNFLLKL